MLDGRTFLQLISKTHISHIGTNPNLAHERQLHVWNDEIPHVFRDFGISGRHLKDKFESRKKQEEDEEGQRRRKNDNEKSRKSRKEGERKEKIRVMVE